MKAWTPRERAELERNTDYWNKERIPKSERLVLLPVPDVSTRSAALLSGRVDWIEVPPPDGIPSLKQAGFVISTGSYPHVWPWFYNMAAKNSPLADVRVRVPVAATFPLERAQEAYDRFTAGGKLGKLVLVI